MGAGGEGTCSAGGGSLRDAQDWVLIFVGIFSGKVHFIVVIVKYSIGTNSWLMLYIVKSDY